LILTNLSHLMENKANQMLRRAWVNMGLPFAVPMVDEKREGIIDVEALLILTILLMKQDRIVTDLPAWIIRFKDLINHQKLKTMVKASPEKYQKTIIENLNQDPFAATPDAFKRIFNLQKVLTNRITETIEMRTSKLNSLENVAQSSIMLKNRLLYGTGFRADLIAITHIKNLTMNGKQLAHLLCSNSSTISRILNDLRASQFLNRDNERATPTNPYPGMFLSTQTIWNMYEMLDAEELQSDELRKATYENLTFKHDKFGKQIAKGGG